MIEIQSELLERCRKGDKRAETELYKLMYGFLMGICRRYQYQEEKARELVNLGYYRILTNLPKYQAIAPFRYWAAKVMVNVVINEHKKEKLHYGSHAYTENYSDDAAFSSINEAVDKHNIERIVAYINLLPIASRNVFNLYVVDGYSHLEIAQLLGISEGTSKWHLNAAREKLKLMLQEKKTKVKIEND